MPDTDLQTLVGENKDIRNQLRELARLQDADTARIAAAATVAEKEQKDRKDAQEAGLATLLTHQVAEAEERSKRQGLLNKLLGALVVVATSAAGGGAYLFTRAPDKEDAVIQSAPVVEAIEVEADETAERMDELEDRAEWLYRQNLQRIVQQSDATEYIADKIDAIGPRQADPDNDRYVAPPPSVRDAKKLSDKIKKQARDDEETIFDTQTELKNPFERH